MNPVASPAGDEVGQEPLRGIHRTVFAAAYGPLLWLGERAGMADRRRELLAKAGGDVLELGAGTGLNLDHYPEGLGRLVLTEPDAAMAARLRKRLGEDGGEVVPAVAESLPFADSTFDTVVSTLVLCTVESPATALREIRRVLRPDGRLLFIEHVRADGERLARWQDRLHGAWHWMFCGCNCNRETLGAIRTGGFRTAAVEHASWRREPVLIRPLVSGVAQPEQEGEG